MRSSPSVVLKSPQIKVASAQVVPPRSRIGSGEVSRGSRQDKAPTPNESESRVVGTHVEAGRIIEEARRQAVRLLAEAESEARDLCRQSQEKAQTLCQEAQDRGYQAGMAQAEEEIVARVDRLMQLAEGAIQAREALLRRSEPEIIELAIGIAEKIVGQELTINRAAVSGIVRRALARAATSDACYLRVNPADAQIIEEYLRHDRVKASCEVVIDDPIEEGGCVIATSYGQVDAQISSQIAEVHAALLGEEHSHDQ